MSLRDNHLGDLAAALVDGALDGAARDRALAHITGCTDCRADVDQQRLLKERLRHCGEPSMPSRLADRLLAIGQPADADESRTPTPSSSQPPAGTAAAKPRSPEPPAGRRPGGTPRPSAAPASSRAGQSRRLRRVTGGVSVLALGVAAALTLGPLREQEPAVSPPVSRYTVEHARTTGGVPGVDPGAGAVMTVSGTR